MPTYRASVGPGGAVTLPVELCERLKIKDGTPVEFFLTVDGQVHFHAITGTARGFGAFEYEKRSPPVSIREMDDAITDHLAEKHDRIAHEASGRGKRPAAE